MIETNIGKLFQSTMVFGGYVLLLLGVLCLLSKAILGLVILVIGLLAAFSTQGSEINIAEKKYRLYTKCVFLKTGSWKSIAKFKQVAIISSRLSSSTFSRGNREITNTEQYFDVVLLNETHRKKLVLSRSKDKTEAKKSLQLFETKLELTACVYSPLISEKTKRRKTNRYFKG
jgi:hypothetical protein